MKKSNLDFVDSALYYIICLPTNTKARIHSLHQARSFIALELQRLWKKGKVKR